MAKIYLVDSENIGSSWSQLLSSMSDQDKMYVFYTDKSPYISYENLLQVIAHCNIPVFIKCFEGKNALDFQLVSELGFKLCQDPEQEFIIVSDDYGYDAAVRYWSGKKYNVHRIGKKYCRPLQPRRNEDAHTMQSEIVAVQVKKEQPVETVAQTDRTVQASEEVQAADGIQGAAEEQAVDGVQNAAEEQVAEVVQDAAEEHVAEVVQDAAEEHVAEVAQGAAEEQAAEAVQNARNTDSEQVSEVVQNTEAVQNLAEQQEIIKEQREEQKTDSESVQDSETVQEQPQKRPKDRRRKRRKENVKESENAEDKTEKQDTEGEVTAKEEVQKDAVKKVAAESDQTVVEVVDSPTKNTENSLEQQILDMVQKCSSPEPEKDAQCVKEIFRTLAMSDLTSVNTALKILIGNELGNDIYRELKEHQECRAQLDALYYPAMKERFIHYVQIVLDRSELQGISAEEAGNFLLRIPRKNLNSIRSAMLKEFGHELGSGIYTTFKPHIKVLNKI